MSIPILKTNSTPDFTRGIARWVAQTVAAFILFGSILFLAYGRTGYLCNSNQLLEGRYCAEGE